MKEDELKQLNNLLIDFERLMKRHKRDSVAVTTAALRPWIAWAMKLGLK